MLWLQNNYLSAILPLLKHWPLYFTACSRTEMEKSPATKVENTEIEGAVGGE